MLTLERDVEATEDPAVSHHQEEGLAYLIASGSRNLAAVIETDARRFIIEDAAFMADLRKMLTSNPRPICPTDPHASAEVVIDYTVIEQESKCDTDRGTQVRYQKHVQIDGLTVLKRMRLWNVEKNAYDGYTEFGRLTVSADAVNEIAEELAEEIRDRM